MQGQIKRTIQHLLTPCHLHRQCNEHLVLLEPLCLPCLLGQGLSVYLITLPADAILQCWRLGISSEVLTKCSAWLGLFLVILSQLPANAWTAVLVQSVSSLQLDRTSCRGASDHAKVSDEDGFAKKYLTEPHWRMFTGKLTYSVDHSGLSTVKLWNDPRRQNLFTTLSAYVFLSKILVQIKKNSSFLSIWW